MPFVYECLGYLYLWCMRVRTRRALAMLEDHELLDIGMSRQQRDEEVARWFWQGVPPRRGTASSNKIMPA